MIAILSAGLDDLYSTLSRLISIKSIRKLENTTIYIGAINGEDVLFTDVMLEGSHIAGVIAEIAICYPITMLIGATNRPSTTPCKASINSLGIYATPFQYDVNFTSFGYPVGYISELKTSILWCSKFLLKLAKKAAIANNFSYIFENSLFSPNFMESIFKSEYLENLFHFHFIDIELSPLSEMASFHKMPSIIIEGISNYNNDPCCNYNFNSEEASTKALVVAITMAKLI